MMAPLMVLAAVVISASSSQPGQPHRRCTDLERSYWVHASLGYKPHKGYWGMAIAAVLPPTEVEVRNAAQLLTGQYAANRLYLVYHKETTVPQAEQVFRWWRQHSPHEVELVPTLVLRTYDKTQAEVFTADELRGLCAFFRREVGYRRLAVFDVYPNRDQGTGLGVLAEAFPDGLIRVGIQPEEKVKPPFVSAVQDTWSGFCHGKTNTDWLDQGSGAETLRRWVAERNETTHPIVWDLVVVAWDYGTTQRGEHPGYDDAARNMPLPAGRNILAAREILRIARPDRMAGFSCDLTILQANSAHDKRDGRWGSFYETLKRAEVYRGYYAEPFAEVAEIYRGLRDNRFTELTGAEKRDAARVER